MVAEFVSVELRRSIDGRRRGNALYTVVRNLCSRTADVCINDTIRSVICTGKLTGKLPV